MNTQGTRVGPGGRVFLYHFSDPRDKEEIVCINLCENTRYSVTKYPAGNGLYVLTVYYSLKCMFILFKTD